jgi:hypothetical protein
MKNYIALLCIILTFAGCFPSKEKSQVRITEKKYVPEYFRGAYSEDEKYLLYVQRTNGTAFVFGNGTCIVETNKECYDKLKIGDTLADKY